MSIKVVISQSRAELPHRTLCRSPVDQSEECPSHGGGDQVSQFPHVSTCHTARSPVSAPTHKYVAALAGLKMGTQISVSYKWTRTDRTRTVNDPSQFSVQSGRFVRVGRLFMISAAFVKAQIMIKNLTSSFVSCDDDYGVDNYQTYWPRCGRDSARWSQSLTGRPDWRTCCPR